MPLMLEQVGSPQATEVPFLCLPCCSAPACPPTHGSVEVQGDPWKCLESSLSGSRNEEVLEGPFFCLDATGLAAVLTIICRYSDFWEKEEDI